MRYVLIDRITALVPGRSIEAVKSVSHGDDLVTRYAPGLFALPAAMVLEAMAQAAGLLVVATTAMTVQPMLAKVQPFTTHGHARPGDRVDIRAEIAEMRSEGCQTTVSASVDGRPLADATIYLALLPLDEPSRAATLRSMLADMYPRWFS
jgi:3-hydroxyacyl-[acyl-carrier-protein] dehydratase